MADESVSATSIINAQPEVVFAILADPAKHAAIDGTGWVREPLDSEPLTAPGQLFRMAMYHPNHPDGNYQMSNRVQVFDPPNAVSWEPGRDNGDGTLSFGGWVWRYDLTPTGSSNTRVTLSYDWSAVPDSLRQHIGFPPFPPDHLRQLAGPSLPTHHLVTGSHSRQPHSVPARRIENTATSQTAAHPTAGRGTSFCSLAGKTSSDAHQF